ncbi:MAG TPA: acyl-CoA dehydrogenase family protein [Acidimicrobiales bacterium]|nr:acyl-CoA dehydrogenase family protein [Acidimicrobiales bacterium]
MRWKVEDTPERAAFRAGFKSWLQEVLPDGWVDALERRDDAAFATARKGFNFLAWMGTIGSTGYAAPLWPREYGGLSGEPWMQQIVREELANHRLPTFGLNLLGVGLAGPTMIAHASDEQKLRYLPRILSGEEIWCQLFSEPGSGSDLASLSTRAVRDGDEWIVNGQKVWTSIASIATFGMLLARTDPDVPKHEGLSYFIVDMHSPGIEIRPLRQITGSADFNEVFFTDVRVPDLNRIGEAGEGWRYARTTLMNERVALSGLSIDAASLMGGPRRDPWEAFLSGVKDRTDPILRQELARIYTAQEVKEITAFRASAARLAGQTPGAEGGVTKVCNAELNQHRSNVAMNAAGMTSIAWEAGVAGGLDSGGDGAARATAFLRTRANTIEGGTSEVLRNQIGERILGLPREVEVDKGVSWAGTRRS